MIPAGIEHFASYASFFGFLCSEEVQGQSAQGRQVFGGVALPSAALVFAERNIHDPVDFVFHAPVTAHGSGKGLDIGF